MRLIMHTVVLSGLALLALGCSSPAPEPKGDQLFPRKLRRGTTIRASAWICAITRAK